MPATADDWDWWFGVWRGLINCGACGALMHTNAPCPVCGQDYRNVPTQRMEVNGKVVEVQPAFAGAISWSDYVLLRLMHQEWQRPAEEHAAHAADRASLLGEITSLRAQLERLGELVEKFTAQKAA